MKPPASAPPLRLLLGLLAASVGVAQGASEPDPEIDVWTRIVRLQYEEAERDFERREAGSARIATAESRLAQAILLLYRQPRTDPNVREAQRKLVELVDADDTPLETRLAARYHLARVHHFHAFAPDVGLAEQLYASLWQQHPESLWGQLALTKLAISRIYRPGESREEKRTVLAHFEDVAPQVTFAPVRSNLHRVLGEAWGRLLDEPERQLHHTLATLEWGVAKSNARARLLLQAGEAARRLGRHRIARACYTEFLRDFPRDERVWLVQQRLAGLPAEDAS